MCRTERSELTNSCPKDNRVNVAWNNSFRHIFSGFRWESVKPLQYYTATLPILYFIDQRKLLFWEKLAIHNIYRVKGAPGSFRVIKIRKRY